MGQLPQSNDISVEQYLTQYANDTYEKWELVDGMVYAMGGASSHHATICLNIASILKQSLKDKPCKPYMNNLRMNVSNNYYYPDVVVDCGQTHVNRMTAEKPLLIIEVLSKSTAFIDRTKKLLDYQEIISLQEYVLIEQTMMKVIIYRRHQQWQGQTYQKGDTVAFASLDLVVPIEAIYEDIVFGDNPLKVL